MILCFKGKRCPGFPRRTPPFCGSQSCLSLFCLFFHLRRPNLCVVRLGIQSCSLGKRSMQIGKSRQWSSYPLAHLGIKPARILRVLWRPVLSPVLEFAHSFPCSRGQTRDRMQSSQQISSAPMRLKKISQGSTADCHHYLSSFHSERQPCYS